METNSSGCPRCDDVAPPTYEQSAQDEFLDNLASMSQDGHGQAQVPSPDSAREAERIRNFIRFSLAVDYQCADESVAFSATDRAHFATMHALRRDLSRTVDIGSLTMAERKQLAPYFWHTLHEPCAILNIPVDIVIGYVSRFFKYQAISGEYKGCLFNLPQCEGLDRWAQKLVTDCEIVVPRVHEDPKLRRKMFDAIEWASGVYFSHLSGIDSTEYMASAGGPDLIERRGLRSLWYWVRRRYRERGHSEARQIAAYELNLHGRMLELGKQECDVDLRGLTQWIEEAKECVAEMLRARFQVGYKAQRNVPRSLIAPRATYLVWSRSYDLPDFFGGWGRRQYIFG